MVYLKTHQTSNQCSTFDFINCLPKRLTNSYS
jgi:hypothetical protein